MRRLTVPFGKNMLGSLKAGEEVLLNGTIYTARDQAHKRMAEAVKAGRGLPIDLKGACIYYCGPTHTPYGRVIGSCGPTTSSRMDAFTPLLLLSGLRAVIGKGARSQEVRDALRKHKGVYFLTYAGCGALLSGCVKKRSVAVYGDLGPEAVFRMEVEDFPLIVAIDTMGNSVYK